MVVGRVVVMVVVVGATRHEHAALITAGANFSIRGGLYPDPEPLGGVQRASRPRFFPGGTTVTVAVL